MKTLFVRTRGFAKNEVEEEVIEYVMAMAWEAADMVGVTALFHFATEETW